MNCFNCEMEGACKTCLDRISQKKTCSIDINMLKRKTGNECYQMLPYYQIDCTNLNKITLILNLQEKF